MTMRGKHVTGAILVVLASLATGACGEPAADPAAEVTPTPTPPAGPRTLVAQTLDRAALGPRIVGPDGAEVTSQIAGVGTLVSFVACPLDVPGATCDPATLPADTVYTYVHTVTLDAAENAAGDGGEPRTALSFRTTMPAPGFTLSIGYDQEQAMAALGPDYAITTQIENGALTWRVTAGDGWMPGETLTFFWLSNAPPAGPAEAYALEVEGPTGTMIEPATGPFPAPDAAGDDTP